MFFLFLVLFFSADNLWASEKSLVDYSDYDHTITLESFRAGNHSLEGPISYFVKVTLQSYLKTKEELRVEEAKKKTQSLELGSFFPLKLPSLSIWKPSPKEREKAFMTILGDDLRRLIAITMQNFSVTEGEVAIRVRVEIFAEVQKYMFLRDEVKIGEGGYFPIPLDSEKIREDAKLSIEDDKGAYAHYIVAFKKNQPTKTPDK